MLVRAEDGRADLRVIAWTSVLALLSLAVRTAMTASLGQSAIVPDLCVWLPLIAVTGVIACAGIGVGARSVATLGYGLSMVAIVVIYLPEATEAALHFGREFAYTDDALAAADRAIGFDWMAYARWMDANSALWTAGRYAYLSMPMLPLVVVMALSLDGATQRLATYFVAQILCLTIVAGIAVVTPALGAYAHYHAADAPFVHHDFVTAARMTRSLEWLRQTRLAGDGVTFHGLVSFPSYHAMSCVMNAWATWRMRAARWPMALLNGLILIATPVQGSHYLVDIIAGLAIAALAIEPAARGVALLSSRRPAGTSPPVLVPA